MGDVRSFIVEVPVTIEAADEASFQAAKQHLRKFFHRIEAGANEANLVYKVTVDKSRLIPRDTDNDSNQ